MPSFGKKGHRQLRSGSSRWRNAGELTLTGTKQSLRSATRTVTSPSASLPTVTAWIPLFVLKDSSLPPGVLLIVMGVAAFGAGAIWGLIPAALKAYLRVNEIITTLMLNYIAILLMDWLYTGPWKDKQGYGFPGTASIKDIAALPRLRLRGLMAIPEPAGDFSAQRVPHRALRELLAMVNGRGLALDTLSMGMSADLEAAVAEGATIVRVGTAVFGGRG